MNKKLIIKYAIFCLIAIAVNVLSQFLCEQYLKSIDQDKIFFLSAQIISLGFGTFTGLLTKFFLDKKYIFDATFETKNQTILGFFIYMLMGLVTTTIFWGFELSAYAIFENNIIKYIAGVIGLIIGYICKYNLDKKFVFSKSK